MQFGHHLEGKPRYGYVFDLRHAFLKITDKMLERELRLYLGEENTEVISAFADFTTVARRLREGTVCAPFGFNLIMKPFDNAMKILTKEKDLILSGEENDFELTFSRYADNCAFLSPRPLDFEKLKRQVQRFVKGHGLELSWEKTFADEPTIYLGTAIYKDIVNLDPEKLGFYYDVL